MKEKPIEKEKTLQPVIRRLWLGRRVITVMAKPFKSSKGWSIETAIAVKCPSDRPRNWLGRMWAERKVMMEGSVTTPEICVSKPSQSKIKEAADNLIRNILVDPYAFIPALTREHQKLEDKLLAAERKIAAWENKFYSDIRKARRTYKKKGPR